MNSGTGIAASATDCRTEETWGAVICKGEMVRQSVGAGGRGGWAIHEANPLMAAIDEVLHRLLNALTDIGHDAVHFHRAEVRASNHKGDFERL